MSHLRFLQLSVAFALMTLRAATQLPDSIAISDESQVYLNSYSYRYTLVKNKSAYKIYQHLSATFDNKTRKSNYKRKKVGSIPTNEIENLLSEINSQSYPTLRLNIFGYDSVWLKANNDLLFNYIRKDYDYWTDLQKNYIKEQLNNQSNYEEALRHFILKDNVVVLFDHSESNFDAIL
jgi:hypothetical protein